MILLECGKGGQAGEAAERAELPVMCGEGKQMWTEIAATLDIPGVYAMAS